MLSSQQRQMWASVCSCSICCTGAKISLNDINELLELLTTLRSKYGAEAMIVPPEFLFYTITEFWLHRMRPFIPSHLSWFSEGATLPWTFPCALIVCFPFFKYWSKVQTLKIKASASQPFSVTLVSCLCMPVHVLLSRTKEWTASISPASEMESMRSPRKTACSLCG